MKNQLTPWQRVTALTVEGLCFLPFLLLRGAEIVGVWQLATPTAPRLSADDPFVWVVLGSWLLQGLLLPPLRLSRTAFYYALATKGGIPSLKLLGTGFRHWGGAIRWRARVWWQRLTALVLVAIPTALLWGWAAHLTAAGYATTGLAWLVIGGLLLVPGLLLALVWECRLAPVPLLLLAGYPTGAAISLAPRLMTGKKRAYINFRGGQLGRWAAGGLVIPLPFVLPAGRVAHIRWLVRHIPLARTSAFPATGACILPTTPI